MFETEYSIYIFLVTMLQAERSIVLGPMTSLNCFNLHNLSSRTRPWGLLSF
jgi:hypothetical protein